MKSNNRYMQTLSKRKIKKQNAKKKKKKIPGFGSRENLRIRKGKMF